MIIHAATKGSNWIVKHGYKSQRLGLASCSFSGKHCLDGYAANP